MKRQNKIVILLVVTLTILNIICIGKVYADPNSSKGFAEYDDMQAEEENTKMLEEQQKEIKASEGKSTNNYLDDLKVEGYELTPKFDKQTIEYTLNGVKTGSQINIVAIPSDTNATVQGVGKVKLEENQKQIRIDVVAESGTVRTYTIYLSEQAKQEEQNAVQEQNELQENQIKEEDTLDNVELESIEASSGNINGASKGVIQETLIYIIIGVIIIVFVIVVLIKKCKGKKGKHC